MTQLESGKSLADVAKAQGKSVERPGAGDHRRRPGEARPGGQANGKLTSAERDQILTEFKAHLDDLVNGTPRGRPEADSGRVRLAHGRVRGTAHGRGRRPTPSPPPPERA